ncbi:hypothetical protein KJA15_01805 [Patescibacteria group bacterium]|nr:hypothetical protein [Patescibacteria group bacterium]
MNFLKPDWRKIVIFVILFFISILLQPVEPQPSLMSYVVFGLIPSYLLSCLTIWIYDKITKKP